MSAIKQWATRSGAITAKNKDISSLKDIEQSFKELMHARQESLRAFGTSVLLSSVVQKGVGGKVRIDEKQLKKLVASYRKEFKEVLTEYEKTGKLKLSKKEYRTKEIEEKLIKELSTMITDIERERTMQKGLNATEQFEEFKSKYAQREQKSELGKDTPAEDSISNTIFASSNINSGIDTITESIRKEILQKQREQLRLYFSTLAATRPELAEYTLDDERFRKFLSELNNEQRKLVNNALENEKVKTAMEQIEIAGYRNIHNSFRASVLNPNGFKPMDWSSFTEINSRSQIVRNEAGAELCTLKEQTHTTTPLTISKQDGSMVIVSSYRTIDFPVKLEEPASGTMHMSLVARDKDGKAPSAERAVYFTAHYEATPKPNGVPKLKEVSSPAAY